MLPGHVIRTEKVANEGSCRVRCFLEPNCVSINVGPADDQGQRTCELKKLYRGKSITDWLAGSDRPHSLFS